MTYVEVLVTITGIASTGTLLLQYIDIIHRPKKKGDSDAKS